MMVRNATITRRAEDFSYEVILFENNQAVHRKTYADTEYKEVQELKESWLRGGGPELLSE